MTWHEFAYTVYMMLESVVRFMMYKVRQEVQVCCTHMIRLQLLNAISMNSMLILSAAR